MRFRDTSFHQQVQKVSDLEQDVPVLHEQIAAMKEQLRILETAWHPHIEEIQSSHLKHVEVPVGWNVWRLGVGGNHHALRQHLEDEKATRDHTIQDLHAKLSQHGEQHSSVQDRVDYLERLMGGSVDRHAKAGHMPFTDRMEYLEQFMGDSLGKHEKVLNGYKSGIRANDGFKTVELAATLGDHADKHGKALAELQAKMTSDTKSSHASLAERLKYIEQLLGDSVSKHGQELADAKAKLDEMHVRVTGCEAHGDSLKKDHHGSQVRLEEHHATLAQRLDFLEKAMGDSFEKHAKAHGASLDTLKKAHSSLQSLILSRAQTHGEHIDTLKKAHNALTGSKAQQDVTHASLRERVDFLEASLGDNADKHGKALAELKASHAKMLSGKVEPLIGAKGHMNRQRGVKPRLVRPARVEGRLSERLQYIEQTLGDSLTKHAQELSDARAKLGEMHTRVSQCEVHGEHIDSLKKAHTALAGNKVKLEEKLEEHHATLAERVNALEKELASTGAKVDAAHSRVSDERAAREAHGASLDTLQKSHNSLQSQKAQQDAFHASLRERVEFLESSLGDNADKHGKALAELRASHAKMVTDAKTKETAHSSLTERLQYVEQLLGDSATKHAQELADARVKLDEMHGRVSKCEAQGEHIDSLKKANATIAGNKAALEEHHASLAERVGFLEKALGDSADRHSAELATTRSKVESLHSRLGVEQQEQSHTRAKHYSLEDRLNFLETYLGESKEKHAGPADVCSKRKLEELRNQVLAERSTRTRQGEAISEHLESEKRAREALEEAVAHHMANHKQTMESHEKRVQDQFGHERVARERHAEHVEALVKQEKDARGQHHEIHTDLISKERAARQQIEELLQKESHERSRHHETIGERVDSLQRTVGIFDTLMRKAGPQICASTVRPYPVRPLGQCLLSGF
ncbi:unnamed protein product [Symbiodinium natans]|uniref:Uncharacterized protein n=1 Tax=Symbiodinium natans TaxID=878477 RepID=A0A812NR53_9DINO|nr:unnamed protein product [Symbiodinium natans]